MDVQVYQPHTVFQPTGYAHAVRLGDFLFVSGQTPRNQDGSTAALGDIRGQAKKAFENLEAVLEECGSGLEQVGMITVFMTKLEYRPVISEVRQEVFAKLGRQCASTTLVISSLVDPEWMVEIEAIAAMRK
jgi:enamine deaminase RidA (YjgF/YER057c/UK114 family)